ncbi:hypothetical protein Ancab_025274 [Ancistrocladus abbreviatus]
MEGLTMLIFHFALIFSNLEFLTAVDTLTPTESLSDGPDNQTMISSRQVFELGFFSPANSRNRYLGIWYKSISLTVVWVANRNTPLTDQSGVLNISDGNLVLIDRNGSIFWSSNSTTTPRNPIAQILDSGNLVLRDANDSNSGNYPWQSFDHPADTLLPGMKMAWDRQTGMNRVLTSWKSSDDPSTGAYSCGIERQGVPQIVIRSGATEVFRSGEWYGDRFSGRHMVSPDSVFNATFVYDSEEVYFTTGYVNPAIFARFVMSGQTGNLEGYISNDNLQWGLLFTFQQDRCDKYALCGPNGICDTNLSHNCDCLTGFLPKSSKEWDVYNTVGGCVRSSPLDCGKGEGFLKYSGVKLPDVLDLRENLSISATDCHDYCLRNCNCTAYASSNSSGNGQGCLFWYGNLVDIRYAPNDYGQDLYVRLSASALESIGHSRTRRSLLAVIIAVSLSCALLLMSLITWYVVLRKRKEAYATGGQLFSNMQRSQTVDNSDEQDTALPTFDFKTVSAATNDFSFGNKIGEGGFGPVYKGILPTGQEIAVKRLAQTSGQGLEELKNEVILMSKLQHRNLVRLLGCCIQGEERMLVYEYMVNRSLDTHLFDETRSKDLGWNMRFEIISGIARGLLYLHRDSRLRIIHRDLKVSNILLDKDMTPKISDFGLARMFGCDQTGLKTRKVVGTYGYLSPEYAVDGQFSIKSDVFSFGVIILEIISRRRNRGFSHPGHGFNLVGHAWNLWNERRALELVDPSLGDQFSKAEALRCIRTGLLCVQQRPEDRPLMPAVFMMLYSENAVLPEPKLPGFYTERNLNEADSVFQGKRCETSNELTMTTVEAR